MKNQGVLKGQNLVYDAYLYHSLISCSNAVQDFAGVYPFRLIFSDGKNAIPTIDPFWVGTGFCPSEKTHGIKISTDFDTVPF